MFILSNYKKSRKEKNTWTENVIILSFIILGVYIGLAISEPIDWNDTFDAGFSFPIYFGIVFIISAPFIYHYFKRNKHK